MTIHELKQLLNQFPDDTPVVMYNADDSNYWTINSARLLSPDDYLDYYEGICHNKKVVELSWEG